MQSSRLGMPGQRENVVKLHADHSTVCKFGLSQDDRDNLKLVKSNVRGLYKEALKTGKFLTLFTTSDVSKEHDGCVDGAYADADLQTRMSALSPARSQELR
jgi:hypothetical protein